MQRPDRGSGESRLGRRGLDPWEEVGSTITVSFK